jgi:FKBP-type peptidyl-prolyl cis-trans isomerase FkpA
MLFFILKNSQNVVPIHHNFPEKGFTMQKIIALTLAVLLSTTAFAADKPKTDDPQTFYAIGLSVARSLAVFNLTAAEQKDVLRGIADSFSTKKTDLDLAAYTDKIQELARARRKEAGDKQIGAGKAYLEKAAKEKGAVKTASGIVYQSRVEGKGESPKATDVVKVNYRGTLIDGKEFDSSYKRGKPLEFRLDNVIKCWTEAVQKMKPGGKATIVCPSDLAYGEKGSGELILPGATLSFDVELLEFRPDTARPGSAVAAPPAAPVKK